MYRWEDCYRETARVPLGGLLGGLLGYRWEDCWERFAAGSAPALWWRCWEHCWERCGQ